MGKTAPPPPFSTTFAVVPPIDVTTMQHSNIHFRDADDAVYDLNGKEFMGERVTVEIARGTPHGRDRERWGEGDRRGGGDRRRERSPGVLCKTNAIE